MSYEIKNYIRKHYKTYRKRPYHLVPYIELAELGKMCDEILAKKEREMKKRNKNGYTEYQLGQVHLLSVLKGVCEELCRKHRPRRNFPYEKIEEDDALLKEVLERKRNLKRGFR